MKNTAKKMLQLLAVLLVGVWFLTGCSTAKTEPASQAPAEEVLQMLLACTQEQAEAVQAAATPQLPQENVIGIVVGDNMLENLLRERYGSCFTEAGMEKLMANRIFYKSVSLVEQYSEGIETSELTLESHGDTLDVYSYQATLKTTSGKTVGTAAGTISMQLDGENWKANDITLNIK